MTDLSTIIDAAWDDRASLGLDTGGEVRTEAVRAVQARVAEMDVSLDIVKEAPGWPPVRKTSVPAPPAAGQQQAQERPRPSLGSLLWSHLGKLSNNFSY